MQSESQTFAAEPSSVGAARRFAAATVAAWGLSRLEDDIRSAASELATNAALHAKTPFTVTVVHDGQVVQLRVTDSSAGRPRRSRHDEPESTTGRGLAMVETLAREWGVTPEADGGKTVWCEFPTPVPSTSSDAQDHVVNARSAPARRRGVDAAARAAASNRAAMSGERTRWAGLAVGRAPAAA